jgi:transposase
LLCGVSVPTAHRRFTAWTKAGLWPRLYRAVLEELGAGGADRPGVGDRGRRRGPCEKGGTLTGPNPVDRGKKGSKLHVLSDAAGLPLVVAVSAANLHDSKAFKPLLMALPAIRSRRGPRRRRPVKVRADKAYHSAEHLAWLRGRGIIPRIARPGIESGGRLGRHRWVLERTLAWLLGYRRLTVRYERHGRLFVAFLTLAATITCYKKLAKFIA